MLYLKADVQNLDSLCRSAIEHQHKLNIVERQTKIKLPAIYHDYIITQRSFFFCFDLRKKCRQSKKLP
ncbi:hypothetical protein DERP_004808 [Dermatophagoides pteronyssinus]|uniref:Uncharacterized protein n=1 Tax=Dermatophagoides pteronyssinus TaxID=6956 RepID=A0ABQ8JSN3_DERPT|nr:hypothetical protein DERP_004808 [Dermatophagoides pteronyssinus]